MTRAHRDDDTRGFTFGPLERPALVAGIRARQFAGLLAGLIIGLGLRAVLPPGLGGAAFIGACVIAALLAFVSVRDLTAAEWLTTLYRYGLRPRRRVRSGAASDPVPVLPGVSIIEDPQRRSAVIREDLGHRDVGWSSVLQVRGRDFAIASAPDQARILERWGAVLAARCREQSPLRRLQVLDRALLVPNHPHIAHLDANGDHRSPFFDEYRAEQLQLAPSLEHEAFVVVQVALSRARAEIGRRGGGDVGGMAVLRDEVDRLTAELREVLPGGAFPITSRRLAWLVRSSYDPTLGSAVQRDSSPASIAPAFEAETLTTYQSQEFHHATLWVREWPRLTVGPAFQLPLLLETRCSRSYSVVYAPVAPSRSLQAAQAARTSQASDEHIRRRWGFLDTMTKQYQRAAVNRREEELAAGHQELRFAGYLTVTAPSADELHQAVAEVVAKARQSNLDVTRMVGEHAKAFAFTLPLARGLDG